MEFINVWILVIIVAGNIAPVGMYETTEACDMAGQEWVKPRPRSDGKTVQSTGRSYKCIPSQIPK